MIDIFGANTEEDQQLEILMAFAGNLAGKRKEAVKYRRESGIEKIWQEDEDAYDAIDEFNSHEQYYKPTSMNGRVTYSTNEGEISGCTLYTPITQMYVDLCAARAVDMLTPTNDKQFSFKPTPIATSVASLKNDLQSKMSNDHSGLLEKILGSFDKTGQAVGSAQVTPVLQSAPPSDVGQDASAMQPDAMQGMQPQGLPPAQPAGLPQAAQQGLPAAQGNPLAAMMGAQPQAAQPNAPQTPEELAQAKVQDEAQEAAEKAEQQIWDWLEESGWVGELRKNIQSMAKIGSGVLKGPFPYRVTSRESRKTPFGMELIKVDRVQPGSKFISPWNLYPDPACGDDIHNGSFVFERDNITSKQLQEFLGQDYLDDQIKIILKEGPNKAYENDNDKRNNKSENDRYEIWYYHGFANAEELRAAGCECDDDEVTPVVVTMVNDRVIKATLSVLDSGEFPYDIFVWQEINDSPWGKGIGRIIRTEQRKLNAAVRNLMDNAGISAGPQIILKDGVITPADGEWELTPRKIWLADANADAGQVQHAMSSIVIPSLQAELMEIIKMSMEMAEKLCQMPLMMQGSQGGSPETAQGRQLLQNNSNTALRRVARNFDDRLVPHLKRYYEWLMVYGEDDSCKGDFQIQAMGSTSLYERDASNQFLSQIAPLVMNPQSGMSYARWLEQMLKANKVDYKPLMLTDAEKAEAAQQQPPAPPQIEAANIRSQSAIQIAQLNAQSEAQNLQLKNAETMQELEYKERLAATQLSIKMDEAERQREHEIAMEKLRNQNVMMQYAMQHNLTWQQVEQELKVDVARDALKLKTQKELSQEAMAADLQKHHSISGKDLYKHNTQASSPLVEPAGRASPGQAYAE
jgi:hypothetical protein